MQFLYYTALLYSFYSIVYAALTFVLSTASITIQSLVGLREVYPILYTADLQKSSLLITQSFNWEHGLYNLQPRQNGAAVHEPKVTMERYKGSQQNHGSEWSGVMDHHPKSLGWGWVPFVILTFQPDLTNVPVVKPDSNRNVHLMHSIL